MQIVQLVKVQQGARECPKYACLSYCWGGAQPGMTIADKLRSSYENIDVARCQKPYRTPYRSAMVMNLFGLTHLAIYRIQMTTK